MQYKGVPLEELKIETIAWTEDRAEHVRLRPGRQSGGTALEPEWATEAALDPLRIIRVAGTEKPETSSLKVIGESRSFGGLLKVWIWSDEPATSGTWNGGSACVATDSDRRGYAKGDSR